MRSAADAPTSAADLYTLTGKAASMSEVKITCGHPDRKHQGKGMCQQCYLKDYYSRNRDRYRYNRAKFRKENWAQMLKKHREHYARNKQEYGEKRRAKYQLIKDDPDYQRQRQSAYYKHLYGITLEEYASLLDKQGGVCAICHRPERAKMKNGKRLRLAVDHDHNTGKIRGLLCGPCNRSLGAVGENIKILKATISYLEHYS